MARASASKNQPARWITCLGLALAITPLANAQQFQTPRLPGESAMALPPELQARIQHAEALKAQMLRAQYEQGAPSEFAQKAFEAQQAYQAERAYDEYMAFLKKQQQLQQVPPNQVAARQANAIADFTADAYQPAPKRLPQPVAQAAQFQSQPIPATSQPSTFAPPVHVAPTNGPSPASLGDDPKPRPEQAYQPPARQLEQVAYQETTNQTDQAPVQPLYEYQPPRALGSYPTQPRRQLGTPQRIITAANPTSRQPAPRQSSFVNSTRPQATSQQQPYILQENSHEGLQDRIANLLSRPRYQDTESAQLQRQTTSRIAAQPIGSVNRSRVQPRQTTPQPRRGLHQAMAANSLPQPTNRSLTQRPTQYRQPAASQSARQPTMATAPRRDAEVQHAFEMQQRMERSMQNRLAVQQVAMVEPVQDPFNDQSIALPPSSNSPRLQTPPVFYQPTPPRGSNPPALAGPAVDRDQPMKQVSVLSNSTQSPESAQDNQFGQPLRPETAEQPLQDFQPPVQGDAAGQQVPFGDQAAQDAKQGNDELNRRMRELESGSGDESARIDAMVKELEQELDEGRPQTNDPVVNDSLNNRLNNQALSDRDRIKSGVKTCDEFRRELLDNSIRDIALDISPLASRNLNPSAAVSRTWTDRAGNTVAIGKMVDLRRGYVIIEGPEGRQRIAYARLGEADWTAIAQYWQLPELCSIGNEGDASRNWAPQTYTWKASALCHKPLFFENIQLERYGHTHGPIAQPIRSVAHFFVSFVTVPYQSGIHPATECQYALGFYRPGDCAPWLKNPIPLSLSGAARQAIVTTGVAVLP